MESTGGKTLESDAWRDKPVLVSGMFDMANFGDLLFPLVAEYRLGAFGLPIVPVSPTAARVEMSDVLPSVSIGEVVRGEVPARGMLIGGGYIIHNHSMAFLAEYAGSDLAEWVGAGMWLGMTVAASLQDVPLAWNAPGVPHPFATSHRAVVDAAIRATDYVCLRDKGSRELLACPADVDVTIVPDPVADLARLWPARTLDQAMRGFLDRKEVRRDARLAAVHVRNRSLAGLGSQGVAKMLDAFAAHEGLLPVLMAVGRSHEDDRTARAVSSAMREKHVVLDDPVSLREVASIICNSTVYVGASLHGYVAAASYGIPGVLVARPAYRKFAGFLEHTGRKEDLAGEWAAAFSLASTRLQERATGIPEAVYEKLDGHWARVAAALSDRDRRHRERQAFLRTCFQVGIAADGPGWAHRPFVRRSKPRREAVASAARSRL